MYMKNLNKYNSTSPSPISSSSSISINYDYHDHHKNKKKKRMMKKRGNGNNMIVYKYEIMYYDERKNKSVKGEIIKIGEKVRGYNFVDENGNGYINPLSYDDGKNVEYKIEGECNCCYECLNDGNKCNDEEYCVDNKCVECRDEKDCGNGDICNRGNCINGDCANNNDCGTNEICNNNGECIEGCKFNDECKRNKGELSCLNGECVNGCKNNFDCNDYDNVCIENQCISIENAINCVEHEDCNMGYYCNFEYMMCVKSRRDTFITHNRRNKEVASVAMCSIYGAITLFLIAASYTTALKISEDELNRACEKRCSEMYFSSKAKVKNGKVTETKKRSRRLTESSCFGWCKPNGHIYRHKILVKGLVDHAEIFCQKQDFSIIISVEDKLDFLKWYSSSNIARRLFERDLSNFCQSMSYDYIHPRTGFPVTSTACAADYDTVECVGENVWEKG